MERYDYDVIVVGGGPAGLVTSALIAERGFSVAVLERDREIGIPVLCGEGVSKKVDELGVIDRGRWIENEVIGARIFSPNGTMVKLSADVAGGETGYVIDREAFDKELARLSIRKGTDIYLRCNAREGIFEEGKLIGVKASLDGKEAKFYAKIIVGADGVESRVARWTGIDTRLKPKDIVSCYEYTLTGIDCDKDYCDFFVGRSIAPGGYIWIFPKSYDTANVGIGVLGSYSRPGLAKELLDGFIEEREDLRRGRPIRELAGSVPVAEPVESVRENLLLVGDAARHTDPLTGGGIMHALIGAKIAGESIARSLEEDDISILKDYENGWKRELERKLKRNYTMKEIATRFDDKTFDKLAESLQGVDFEEFSTYGLIKALVKKHPSLLIKLKPLLGLR